MAGRSQPTMGPPDDMADHDASTPPTRNNNNIRRLSSSRSGINNSYNDVSAEEADSSVNTSDKLKSSSFSRLFRRKRNNRKGANQKRGRKKDDHDYSEQQEDGGENVSARMIRTNDRSSLIGTSTSSNQRHSLILNTSTRSIGNLSEGNGRRRISSVHSVRNNNYILTNHVDDGIVRGVESVLRQILLLLCAYTCGVWYSHWLPYAIKMVEYIGISWLTCIILVLSKVVKQKWCDLMSTDDDNEEEEIDEVEEEGLYDQQGAPHLQHSSRKILSPPVLDQQPIMNGKTSPTEDDEEEAAIETPPAQQRRQRLLEENLVSSEPRSPTSPNNSAVASPPSVQQQMKQQQKQVQHEHPDLEKIMFINAQSNERIFPNAAVPVKLDNELFTGRMLIMMRTSNVDDPKKPKGTKQNIEISQYFKDKSRRFEFQYQVKLKQVPQGKLFCSFEDQYPVKMGMIQRAFVSAALGFMQRMNAGFHASLNGTKDYGKSTSKDFSRNNSALSSASSVLDSTNHNISDNDDYNNGKYELPHVAFTVEDGMNRLVVTKPGETPPELGKEIHESNESIKSRKRGEAIAWNTQDTYTFAIWSGYADFLEWKIMNLPGVRPFYMTNVTGLQYSNMILYVHNPNNTTNDNSNSNNDKTTSSNASVTTSNDKDNRHYRCDMTVVANVEVSHTRETNLGPCAQKWLENNAVTADQEELQQQEETETQAEEEEGEVAAVLDYQDDDQETLTELGDGLVLKSGSPIFLRDADDPNLRLGSSAGFAMMNQNHASTIIIEKRVEKKRSNVIRSGDTVMITRITKSKSGEDETTFLTIHRGWYLKFVAVKPSKNGWFKICAQATEFGAEDGEPLDMFGSFSLRHVRFKNQMVGIGINPSPRFGGTLLGLYNPNSIKDQQPPEDDEYAKLDVENEEIGGKARKQWMRPLILTSNNLDATSSTSTALSSTSLPETISLTPASSRTFDIGSVNMDVPAWIEVLHRTERRPALVYVVRVEDGDSLFFRLRGGRDLAEVVRLGMTWRSKTSSKERGGDFSRMSSNSLPSCNDNTDNYIQHESAESEIDGNTEHEMALEESNLVDHEAGCRSLPEEYGEKPIARGTSLETPTKTYSKDDQYDEQHEDLDVDEEEYDDGATDLPDSDRRKRRGMIRKIGKQVVKQGKKVGKGSAKVARAITPGTRIRTMKPPQHEPKRVNQRKAVQSSFLAVNRTMKSLRLSRPSTVIAGQLSAPEQSLRHVSHVLSDMPNTLRSSSTLSDEFSSVLSSQIGAQNDMDKFFLGGDAIGLGVEASSENGSSFVVARCLWESHWREELLIVSDSCISFYAPLTKTPAVTLSFVDVLIVRLVDPISNPLPGKEIICIETPGLCYYAAFSTMQHRDDFNEKIKNAISLYESKDVKDATSKEMRKARYCQGLQSTRDTGKWAKIATRKNEKQRTIYNGRRMVFDVDPLSPSDIVNSTRFVEELLTMALTLTFSFDNLDGDRFAKFLDMTSQLQTLRLETIDFSSVEAFCMFVNLYHCLLQHALLLGPPLHKRSVGHFMRTSCYEIGGDVFSLAELNNFVIRGKMTNPVSAKHPSVEAARRSRAYRLYSLDYTDKRVNFVLHTADLSCPQDIALLRPTEYLEDQLNKAVSVFVGRQLQFSSKKKTILLPKICDVYRNDFGNSGEHCLLYLLQFLDSNDQEHIIRIIENYEVNIKYQHANQEFYPFLKLREDEENNEGYA